MAVPGRDRERDVRKTVLFRAQPDRPPYRIWRRSGHCYADRDCRRGEGHALHGCPGGCAAASLGRFVGSQLYGVKPADALTIVMAGLLLSAIAAVAALLPAHRAASISPMSALRDE